MANMISAEEDIGGNAFKVRAPEWRSEELNKLMKDLNARADVAATNRAHPGGNRVHGTPLKVPAPASVSAWMIDKEEE